MAPKSRSTKTVSSLALLALAAFAAGADEPKEAPKAGVRVSVDKQRVKCASADERTPCENGSQTHVTVEQELSVKLEIKAKATGACAATVDFEYQQRDKLAHVAGTIENATCAASSGDYVLAVTVNDAKGEPTTLEFPQEWARTDAEPVKFTRDLPIGPNVDLKSVRTRRLRCTCTEAAEKP